MKTIAELAALLPASAVLSKKACKKVKGGENAPPPPPDDNGLIGNEDIIDG
ncbi:hypothetical protein [Phaeodactylibacter luteus]|uniref:hypothetical protein n=1 Tax=Phaeodactylibacter luteus TaxID=1564516 RepID=UPI00147967AB|nr:hypothetical protein [Phaeodactylibacter luteus]